MNSILNRAKQIENDGIFLGGPLKVFELAGRKQLITLLNEGLLPSSKVLDIGCGCLRGGYWLIHFLEKGNYFGIEPNVDMLEAGRQILLEPEIETIKSPKFNNNSNFDFSCFNEKFDYFVARSIWTHASKEQIQLMLDGFIQTANTNGVFLTSYIKPSIFKKDYKGNDWVGKSHVSEDAGIVRHSFSWIQNECSSRGLIAKELTDKTSNFGNQTWIKINFK